MTFSSTTPTICTASGSNGSIVTAMAAGSCVIAANQAGNANYSAAVQAMQTITIAQTGIDLLPGWNLLGNASNQPVAVAAAFADKTIVNTVWKWDAAGRPVRHGAIRLRRRQGLPGLCQPNGVPALVQQALVATKSVSNQGNLARPATGRAKLC